MAEKQLFKPGDTYMLDGTEYVVGKDWEWHPNTSLAGQAAQALLVDAPVGLLGLAQGAANLASPYRGNPAMGGKPGEKSFNFVPAAQRFYEGNARRLGVNIAPPQTPGQERMRIGAQIPVQALYGLASGGSSVAAELAGAAGGTAAAQLASESGAGPVGQFIGGVAGDLASRRNPVKTISMVRDFGAFIKNSRTIKAMKMISPLDLADEGAATMMKQVDNAHLGAKTAMDSAYAKVNGSKFQVSAQRLADAGNKMLAEAGSTRAETLAKNLYIQIQEILVKDKGVVSFDRLRALQKNANAFLDTKDVTRSGLAQQQGQVRQFVIPAIKETMEDMVRAGQGVGVYAPGSGAAIAAQNSVQSLRKANDLAGKYYEAFDKKSAIAKELVDGIAGGQTLDPHKAFQKIFKDPKKSVEYARAVMDIVGVNPRNTSIMRRTFVESVVGPDQYSLAARKAISQLNNQRAAGIEILGRQGFDHFHKMLQKLEKAQASAARSGSLAKAGRYGGGFFAAVTHMASPFEAGLIGAALGEVSGRTAQHIVNHFGEDAATALAFDALYNPKTYALLHANPKRLGNAALNREFRTALIKTGFRFSTGAKPQSGEQQ